MGKKSQGSIEGRKRGVTPIDHTERRALFISRNSLRMKKKTETA